MVDESDDEIDPYAPYVRDEGMTLPEYIASLLQAGKDHRHPDFQLLFRVFGKEKIYAYAREYLAKRNALREAKKNERN
jgi:hypothetical protein